jgi:Leucine-rich repeat (LRR) protein
MGKEQKGRKATTSPDKSKTRRIYGLESSSSPRIALQSRGGETQEPSASSERIPVDGQRRQRPVKSSTKRAVGKATGITQLPLSGSVSQAHDPIDPGQVPPGNGEHDRIDEISTGRSLTSTTLESDETRIFDPTVDDLSFRAAQDEPSRKGLSTESEALPGAYRAQPGRRLVPASEDDEFNESLSEDLYLEVSPSPPVLPAWTVGSGTAAVRPNVNEVTVADATAVQPNRGQLSLDAEAQHATRNQIGETGDGPPRNDGSSPRIKMVRAQSYYREPGTPRRLTFAVLTLILVGALSIGLGLGLSRRIAEGNGVPGSEPPSAAPTVSALQSDWIQNANLFPSTKAALRVADSPQMRALQWVDENEVNEAQGNGSDLLFSRRIQRFALATVYFALDGGESDLAGRWLKNSQHECEWIGVSCSSYVVQALQLSGTQRLQGSLAPEIGLLSALTTLAMNRVPALTHEIPTEIGYLRQLTSLQLSTNALTGSIPTEFGYLSKLVELSLGKNHLDGTIPTEIGDLSSLQDVKFLENKLGGPLLLVSRLKALTGLSLGNNFITGTIPDDLAELTALTTLHLAANRLTGTIPPRLGQLRNVNFLSLRSNVLWGSIPSELGLLSAAQNIHLDSANLTGTLPTELFGLQVLRVLRLDENHLSGLVPSQIGNLRSATSLRLDGNQFAGGVPSEWSAMPDLQELFLNSNKLSGRIPSELALLSSLKKLLLQENLLLTGSVPPELCSLAISNSMNLTVDCATPRCDVSSCPCLCSIDLFSDT